MALRASPHVWFSETPPLYGVEQSCHVRGSFSNTQDDPTAEIKRKGSVNFLMCDSDKHVWTASTNVRVWGSDGNMSNLVSFLIQSSSRFKQTNATTLLEYPFLRACISGHSDGRVCLLSKYEQRIVHERPVDTHAVSSIVVVDNKAILVAFDDGRLMLFGSIESLFGTRPGIKTSPIREHMINLKPVGAVYWKPQGVTDGKILIASRSQIDFFDRSLKLLSRTQPPTTAQLLCITSMGLPGEGPRQRVWSGHADGTVVEWRVQDHTYMRHIDVSGGPDIRAMVPVDNTLWLGCSDGHIRVFDTEALQLLKDWSAHNTSISCLAVSCYGNRSRFVASTSKAGTVRLWDALLQCDWVSRRMTARRTEYTDLQEYHVCVASYNLNAQACGERLDSWLEASPQPDIYAIGFQEIVPLDVGSVLSADTGPSREWETQIASTLSRLASAGGSQDEYQLIKSKQLVGLSLCIFVRSSLAQKVGDVVFNITKTGLKGMAGNKGGVSISLVFQDSLLSFTCVHLMAGQDNVAGRNNDKKTILANTRFQHEGGMGSTIHDHDIAFFFGDLNYRIDLPYEETIQHAKAGNIDLLLASDQLNKAQATTDVWDDFDEGHITFGPTYKFDPGTDDYDSSVKKRSPAWCDRVLYRGTSRIDLLAYRRHPLKTSDHKPVSALFSTDIMSVNGDRRRATLASVREEWRQHLDKQFTSQQDSLIDMATPDKKGKGDQLAHLVSLENRVSNASDRPGHASLQVVMQSGHSPDRADDSSRAPGTDAASIPFHRHHHNVVGDGARPKAISQPPHSFGGSSTPRSPDEEEGAAAASPPQAPPPLPSRIGMRELMASATCSLQDSPAQQGGSGDLHKGSESLIDMNDPSPTDTSDLINLDDTADGEGEYDVSEIGVNGSGSDNDNDDVDDDDADEVHLHKPNDDLISF